MLNELEKQIAEKNRRLDSLRKNPQNNEEETIKLKLELDKLLYEYYKSIGCKYGSLINCWAPV